MPHSISKIWIHAVWATKERMPLLHGPIENLVYSFMRDEFEKLDSPSRIINGMPDHVHCLFSLSRKKSISEIIKQIKGSSSYFINHHDLLTENFAWQTGYAAFSVSESMLQKTTYYIQYQKKQHAFKTFQEEYDEFVELKGIRNQ